MGPLFSTILESETPVFGKVNDYVAGGGGLRDAIDRMIDAQGLNEPVAAPDMVTYPPHYTSHPSGVECIEITRHMGFNLGNALKYIWRADLKGNAVEDLEKAIFYINDELQKRRG